MAKFKIGDEIFHLHRKQFGIIVTEPFVHDDRFYYAVKNIKFEHESTWLEDRCIKVESEQHRLFLMIKYD